MAGEWFVACSGCIIFVVVFSCRDDGGRKASVPVPRRGAKSVAAEKNFIVVVLFVLASRLVDLSTIHLIDHYLWPWFIDIVMHLARPRLGGAAEMTKARTWWLKAGKGAPFYFISFWREDCFLPRM